MRFTLVSALALLGAVAAQRPSNTSICDYYTTALLKNNTGANQYTLLTLLVNTAVIGNYTQPNVNVTVPGILAPGMYMNQSVNLLPYFDGGLASSNRGGNAGVAVNFLDGGGAAPLKQNLPANNNSSNQYMLLTHLYQYFGVLLGCTMYNTTGFPAYMGEGSQYQVHRFMDLNQYEVGYFIEQVGLAAASFGVATADITVAATALDNTFNKRCSPAAVVVPAQGPQLQEICVAPTCSFGATSNCSAYPEPVGPPVIANASLADGLGVSSMAMSASMAMPSMAAASSAVMSAAPVIASAASAVSAAKPSSSGVVMRRWQ